MRSLHPRRSGTVLVMTVLMIVTLLTIVAFAVDIGYIQVVQSQLQRSADAAAIAATWRLLDAQRPGNGVDTPALGEVRKVACQYAGYNQVINAAPGLTTDDTRIGQLSYPFNKNAAVSFNVPAQFNTVTVHVERTAAHNGPVGLFFARVAGINTCELRAEATAAFLNNFAGFRTPANPSKNLDLLPFALDKQTWDGLLQGVGTDSYRYDSSTGQVTSGADGILEVNLYPQGTGSPGNRGTVDIGSSNNSTADITRQIRHGVSEADMAHHGGQLVFNDHGELFLNGDTGISAGVKDDLASIVGQPRIIPIFSAVNGPGNNAQYTIVQFAGIRILFVKLTGSNSSKKVIIQPAAVLAAGAIPASGSAVKSHYVYSPVWLVK